MKFNSSHPEVQEWQREQDERNMGSNIREMGIHMQKMNVTVNQIEAKTRETAIKVNEITTSIKNDSWKSIITLGECKINCVRL